MNSSLHEVLHAYATKTNSVDIAIVIATITRTINSYPDALINTPYLIGTPLEYAIELKIVDQELLALLKPSIEQRRFDYQHWGLHFNGEMSQLAIIPGSGTDRQLATITLRQQHLDAFDIVANPQVLEMFITVACHLNSLQWCHRDKERFLVLTTPFIRDTFQAALSCLVDRENNAANTVFNLDSWYFNLLPDEVKARADPTMEDIQNAGARNEHIADWLGELKKLQERFPGIVHAIHSAIQSQVMIAAKAKDSFNYALNYNRGAEVAPRLGERILKSVSARGGGSVGGFSAPRNIGNNNY